MRQNLTLITIGISLVALALAGPAAGFTLFISDESFTTSGISPSFSGVRSFEFEVDFSAPLVPGGVYDNSSISEVRYIVSGSLSTNPATPSGFSAFVLNRTSSGEGPISAAEWIAQGSSIAFEIAETAVFGDGLQFSELVPNALGLIFELDAREFERLDRARYHPPQLLLYADGTGLLRNSNNSSGGTGTINPGTMMQVDVDFGDEYITYLAFESGQIEVVAPEPGSGLMLGIGLAGLSHRRHRQHRRHSGSTPIRSAAGL